MHVFILFKMRIAFLADSLDKQYGGIHVYTKELLRALAEVDKENEYLVVRSESKNEFPGMEEIVVPYSNFPAYRAWRLFFQLPRLLVKEKVDIVVEPAHFGPFNLPLHIKRVTVVHDLTMYLFPGMHVFSSQLLQRIFLPRVLKKADHIITNSANTSRDLEQFFPLTKSKTTAVLLGKDKRFKPQEKQEILAKYKITKPYILYLGTLEPRKNIDTIIRAFNDFKRLSKLPHQLVLAGKKGWKISSTMKLLENSPFKNQILAPGYIDSKDQVCLYSMAEIFVYPSIYEGFGLPVLEAMSCGTPVITCNNSAIPEVGGDAALYVSPTSVSELTKAIMTLASDEKLRLEIGKKGIKQAAKFSWKETAKATVKIFNRFGKQ